ncbi:MAG TPA: MarR family transcriptional regulator [Acidimicrobiales bacterium]|nr:MarR family transcriptional regulator [Acidimicrobiales bacterium]
MVANPVDPSPVRRGDSGPETREGRGPLGARLRRAWIGYQSRLDEAMAELGFDDRRFPDGRVLRICSEPGGATISEIGRQLAITRQGASKIVGNLRDRGYVAVRASPTSGREKTVTLTPRALDYLAAQRKAARAIESQLRKTIGPEAVVGLDRLLEALGGGEDVRMRDYLRRSRSPNAW